jgi:hypothetical protein
VEVTHEPKMKDMTMSNSNELEPLCTIKEACFTEKAGRTTIYRRIKQGAYKKYKIGGSTRLSVASIKAFRLKGGK